MKTRIGVVLSVGIAAGVAYHIAGGQVWAYGGCALVFFSLPYLGQAWRRIYRFDWRLLRSDSGKLLMLGGASVAWITIGWSMSVSDVWVDNDCGTGVELELDGKPWLLVAGGESRKERLRRGTYRLVVKDGAGEKVLEERILELDKFGGWVLNVLGATTYKKSYVWQGAGPASGHRPAEEIVGQVWFHPDVDFLFEDPASSLVESRATTWKTYLERTTPR